MTKVLKLALPALLLLSACGGAPGSPDIEGRTFVGDTTEGFDLVPGTQVSVTFSGDQVSAIAGCNTMFGAAEWEGDILEVPELAMTEMGCEDDLHEQDDLLAEILRGGPSVTYEGTRLTIEGTDVRIDLEEVLDTELEGTTWMLEGLMEDDAVSSIPEGISPSLVITDGEAKIDFGCNGGGGEVTVEDSTLEFKDIITTLKGCEEEVMRVEQHMHNVLRDTVDYDIDGKRLQITSGDIGLRFHAD